MNVPARLQVVGGTDVGSGNAVDDRALADFSLDDIGNAERLRARHGDDMRQTPGLGVLVFDLKRWVLEPDPSPYAMVRAQLTARAIELEAKAVLAEAKLKIADLDAEDDDDEKDGEEAGEKADPAKARKKKLRKKAARLLAWRTQSSNSAKLGAMLAQAWPHLQHPADQWNAQSHLFNCLNGTLDLSSVAVKLDAHRRDDFITHIAGVEYDPDATCPEFRGFIDRVLPPEKGADGVEDRALQRFVQRSFGVTLIDSVSDQAIIMHHGGGANGKSTLLNAVAYVLGDFCMSVAVQSLLYSEQSGSNASPDVARLAERPRLVRVSEPEPGAKLSEGGVKSLTGGEPIVARKLREAPIEFLPNFKIHVSCNTRPSIKGGDDGIWRRIMLVPWRVQIPEEERREKGPALEAALKREAPGILNWLIEGLMDYYECGGLCPPEVVTAETQAYRSESDVVGRFLSECCDKGDGVEAEFRELYDAFCMWSKEDGSAGHKGPMSAQFLGKRLTDRGLPRRLSNGFTYRCGVELKPEWRTKVREGALAALERETARRGKRHDKDDDE